MSGGDADRELIEVAHWYVGAPLEDGSFSHRRQHATLKWLKFVSVPTVETSGNDLGGVLSAAAGLA